MFTASTELSQVTALEPEPAAPTKQLLTITGPPQKENIS